MYEEGAKSEEGAVMSEEGAAKSDEGIKSEEDTKSEVGFYLFQGGLMQSQNINPPNKKTEAHNEVDLSVQESKPTARRLDEAKAPSSENVFGPFDAMKVYLDFK